MQKKLLALLRTLDNASVSLYTVFNATNAIILGDVRSASEPQGDPHYAPASARYFCASAPPRLCAAKFAVLLALCTLALLMPLPSWAGGWVITFTGSTTEPVYPVGATGWNAVGSYNFTNSVVTGPAPWGNAHPNLTFNGGQIETYSNQTGETALDVTATLTWTPSYPGDTSLPPLTVDVLETASTEVHTGVAWSLGSADDGLGDAQTNFSDGSGSTSIGKHLTHLTVSAGQTTVSLPSRFLTGVFSQGGSLRVDFKTYDGVVMLK